MPKCKSCGARILFIRSRSGKSIPCDAEPSIYWPQKNEKAKVVTPNGGVVCCDLHGEPGKEIGYGYTSHFATCPNAMEHKKKMVDDGQQITM